MKKQDCKNLLRICKDFIKLSYYMNNNNISKPAVYKFINNDLYDEFISEKKVNILVEEIYNSCCLYKDMYETINKKVV